MKHDVSRLEERIEWWLDIALNGEIEELREEAKREVRSLDNHYKIITGNHYIAKRYGKWKIN